MALGAAAVLAAGCSTGSDAVDVNNGGEFRFVAGTPAGEVIPVDDRRQAPEFSGELLDGTEFSSSGLSGDVAVINFWGSWCPPCRVETQQFQEVNVKDEQQLARAFLDSKGVTFPSLYDPRGEVALAFRDYPANAIPSTIVLDREGRVAAVYTAAVEPDDLRRVVSRVVEEG
jgi:peroxiredoxin